jgi:hypothetical protein
VHPLAARSKARAAAAMAHAMSRQPPQGARDEDDGYDDAGAADGNGGRYGGGGGGRSPLRGGGGAYGYGGRSPLHAAVAGGGGGGGGVKDKYFGFALPKVSFIHSLLFSLRSSPMSLASFACVRFERRRCTNLKRSFPCRPTVRTSMRNVPKHGAFTINLLSVFFSLSWVCRVIFKITTTTFYCGEVIQCVMQ